MDFDLEDLITMEQAMNTYFVHVYNISRDGDYKACLLAKLTNIQKELAMEIERRLNNE